MRASQIWLLTEDFHGTKRSPVSCQVTVRSSDAWAYDWAGEQNFARHEGKPFDAVFYRSGESVAAGVWKVDDDVFLEASEQLVWHGRRYRAPLAGVRPPAFLTLDGLADPPPGDAILVLPKRPSLADLWRRPKVTEETVQVTPDE